MRALERRASHDTNIERAGTFVVFMWALSHEQARSEDLERDKRWLLTLPTVMSRVWIVADAIVSR